MTIRYEDVAGKLLTIQKEDEVYSVTFCFSHKDGIEKLRLVDVYDVVDSGHLIEAKRICISNSCLNGEEVKHMVASIEHEFLVEIEFNNYEKIT